MLAVLREKEIRCDEMVVRAPLSIGFCHVREVKSARSRCSIVFVHHDIVPTSPLSCIRIKKVETNKIRLTSLSLVPSARSHGPAAPPSPCSPLRSVSFRPNRSTSLVQASSSDHQHHHCYHHNLSTRADRPACPPPDLTGTLPYRHHNDRPRPTRARLKGRDPFLPPSVLHLPSSPTTTAM